ncbi:hypothetical protein HDU93_007538 [Gonapodya sp. JEL0774]|nr:hypothetical protein HDU93_007538 [Gonapodya sp. JEL0774]
MAMYAPTPSAYHSLLSPDPRMHPRYKRSRKDPRPLRLFRPHSAHSTSSASGGDTRRSYADKLRSKIEFPSARRAEWTVKMAEIMEAARREREREREMERESRTAWDGDGDGEGDGDRARVDGLGTDTPDRADDDDDGGGGGLDDLDLRDTLEGGRGGSRFEQAVVRGTGSGTDTTARPAHFAPRTTVSSSTATHGGGGGDRGRNMGTCARGSGGDSGRQEAYGNGRPGVGEFHGRVNNNNGSSAGTWRKIGLNGGARAGPEQGTAGAGAGAARDGSTAVPRAAGRPPPSLLAPTSLSRIVSFPTRRPPAGQSGHQLPPVNPAVLAALFPPQGGATSHSTSASTTAHDESSTGTEESGRAGVDPPAVSSTGSALTSGPHIAFQTLYSSQTTPLLTLHHKPAQLATLHIPLQPCHLVAGVTESGVRLNPYLTPRTLAKQLTPQQRRVVDELDRLIGDVPVARKLNGTDANPGGGNVSQDPPSGAPHPPASSVARGAGGIVALEVKAELVRLLAKECEGILPIRFGTIPESVASGQVAQDQGLGAGVVAGLRLPLPPPPTPRPIPPPKTQPRADRAKSSASLTSTGRSVDGNTDPVDSSAPASSSNTGSSRPSAITASKARSNSKSSTNKNSSSHSSRASRPSVKFPTPRHLLSSGLDVVVTPRKKPSDLKKTKKSDAVVGNAMPTVAAPVVTGTGPEAELITRPPAETDAVVATTGADKETVVDAQPTAESSSALTPLSERQFQLISSDAPPPPSPILTGRSANPPASVGSVQGNERGKKRPLQESGGTGTGRKRAKVEGCPECKGVVDAATGQILTEYDEEPEEQVAPSSLPTNPPGSKWPPKAVPISSDVDVDWSADDTFSGMPAEVLEDLRAVEHGARAQTGKPESEDEVEVEAVEEDGESNGEKEARLRRLDDRSGTAHVLPDAEDEMGTAAAVDLAALPGVKGQAAKRGRGGKTKVSLKGIIFVLLKSAEIKDIRSTLYKAPAPRPPKRPKITKKEQERLLQQSMFSTKEADALQATPYRNARRGSLARKLDSVLGPGLLDTPEGGEDDDGTPDSTRQSRSPVITPFTNRYTGEEDRVDVATPDVDQMQAIKNRDKYVGHVQNELKRRGRGGAAAASAVGKTARGKPGATRGRGRGASRAMTGRELQEGKTKQQAVDDSSSSRYTDDEDEMRSDSELRSGSEYEMETSESDTEIESLSSDDEF